MRRRETYEVATGVEAIVRDAFWGGEYLQRSWPVHGFVSGGGYGEEIVSADVHHEEEIAGNETAAIGARLESMSADHEGFLGYEVSLVLLLNLAGVTRVVDERDQHIAVFTKSDAAGVSGLDRGALTLKEDTWGQYLASLRCGEYGRCGFRSRGGCGSLGNSVQGKYGDHERQCCIQKETVHAYSFV